MREYNIYILRNLINMQIENSEIYEHYAFKEIEKQLTQYNDIIIEKIGDEWFSKYREARIDLEVLFYQFGFIEGINLILTLFNMPSKSKH